MNSVTLHISQELNNLIHAWLAAERKSQVRKKADLVLCYNISLRNVITALTTKFPEQGDVWYVELPVISSDIYLFIANSEAEVLTLFANLVPKKKIKTSKNVILKMIRKRIQRLQSFVKAFNENHSHDLQRIDLKNSYTIDELLALFKIKTTGSRYWDELFKNIGKQFEEVINKPLFDEQLFKDAWDLLLVEDIHNK